MSLFEIALVLSLMSYAVFLVRRQVAVRRR
jgi:hypothetical protein